MKMPNIIENTMLATCGMNCMVCYVHLKDKNACNGCMMNNGTLPNHCKNCKIKECAQELGNTYCYDCNMFPCSNIKSLDKSYRDRYQVSLIENSNNIKENGFDAFFSKEIFKWTCKECGGVISLHDKECSDCKTKMKN